MFNCLTPGAIVCLEFSAAVHICLASHIYDLLLLNVAAWTWAATEVLDCHKQDPENIISSNEEQKNRNHAVSEK
jgi:hypothetical protein